MRAVGAATKLLLLLDEMLLRVLMIDGSEA
jgi:hypothetical protein